jgi:2-dehydro-3-deoxyphosphooctonate aldolase (KDO 8-P synthase)
MSDFPLLVLGPCVIESRLHVLTMAEEIKRVVDRAIAQTGLPIRFFFKASFDKANRTSRDSYRGPGLELGLELLQEVKERVGVRITTDIHEARQARPVAEVADLLQVPALLSRQTDLLEAAARTGKPVNVKKGQFAAPWDLAHVAKKLRGAGAKEFFLTERGTVFGYNNLVVDFRSIPILKSLGAPVLFDASHSVQQPGGADRSSSGEPEMIPVLARAAIAAGADGLFVEVHDNPRKALSDGPNSLPLELLPTFLADILRIWKAVHE